METRLRINLAVTSIILISILILINCKKEPLKVAPTVTMTSVTNITSVSATTGGTVSDDGGASVTTRGVCWSATNKTPTTDDGNVSSGNGLGSFSSSITGLSPGTMYYVNAYATNSIGTSYSSTSTFTTLALAPTITTTELTNITITTATSGGTISNDGGSPVTVRGVCWSTKESPTIADSKTTDGTGTGSFTSAIINLTPGATYYFRAYATNSINTTYGNQVTAATKEENIVFEVSPFNGTAYVDIKSDVVPFTVKVLSKLPPAGITYSVKMTQSDNSQVVYKLDTSSVNNNVVLQLGKFSISKAYTITIEAKSKANPTNSATKTFPAKRTRVYKNYMKTSYELSNYDMWLGNDLLYDKGQLCNYDPLPFTVMQTAQIDIDGDGLEDIITYKSYDRSINPTPNPPPDLFMNNGKVLNKVAWTGPTVRDPHGTKLLLGDFNGDSIPDIFSLVAVDPPFGISPPYPYKEVCHLLINSSEGFTAIKEFDNLLGYWHTGCSGDIDNDGDLDIVMFNWAVLETKSQCKILWNDGKGNFTSDINGIGNIPALQSELMDVNDDGFLDLVIDVIPSTNVTLTGGKISILWGNGKDFNVNNSTSFWSEKNTWLFDIDFADMDHDGIKEIFLFSTDVSTHDRLIDIYKSDDKGKSYSKRTSDFFYDNTAVNTSPEHIRIQDIDNNGRLDIIGPIKKDNVRWEWNGSKFIKK